MKTLRQRFHVRVVLATGAILVGVLTFSALYKSSVMAQTADEAAVRDVLMKSALSFEKNDLSMASHVWANDESVTVFESGHANYGWADYRDHHLIPEMAEMRNTRYSFTDIKIHLAGKTAWATFKYAIAADVGEAGKTRHVDGGGLGIAVLEQRNGRWQIVHWHSSAPRRTSGNSASPKN